MAVVVSKKIAKSAVTRNKIRRRLYECVRKNEILDNDAIDAVFVVKSDQVASVPHEQLELSVMNSCHKMVDHK